MIEGTGLRPVPSLAVDAQCNSILLAAVRKTNPELGETTGYISLSKLVSQYDSDAASIMKTYNSQHAVAVAKLAAYENKALGVK